MLNEITKLVAPKTEEEITKHWVFIDKVYTSVICVTYNQDTYIRDAIDSFLAQITEYKFEIIIHDDVSTDSTREILKEYQQNYPSIIKLILQDTNQFSININMPFKHSLAIAKGEYIALCEGDDFWIDKNKLQSQLALLLESSELNFCFTKALISEDEMLRISSLGDFGETSTIITSEEIFSKSGSLPTASYLIRKSALNNLPSWFYDEAPVGDVFLEMFSMSKNGVVYLARPTCVYRMCAIGSWTNSINNNKKKKIYATNQMINCFKHMLNENNTHLSTKLIQSYIAARYLELSFYYGEDSRRILGFQSVIKSIKYDCRINLKLIKSILYLFLPPSLHLYNLKKLFKAN